MQFSLYSFIKLKKKIKNAIILILLNEFYVYKLLLKKQTNKSCNNLLIFISNTLFFLQVIS